ncbi:MAG: hypothetical protein OHK0039_48670 [Bacteroidia bacterium]
MDTHSKGSPAWLWPPSNQPYGISKLHTMRYLLRLLLVLALLPAAYPLHAQPLAEVERRLQTLADDILNHDSLSVKISQNREFARLLVETLQRPESYDYPFDSLKTVSVLRAEDGAFRVFTWQIMDRADANTYYGEQQHYYFGLVQRRYETAGGRVVYVVIPLVEMPQIPAGVENMVLDNNTWLGGLYYPARHHAGIPGGTFKYYDPRQVDARGRVKKDKRRFYVLLGWNGMDNTSNLKFVDVMTFDPADSARVIFGANVFYFDIVPKYRALFRYSEYAPFTLNYSYVKKGLRGRKQMIVYDHLASPRPGDQKLQTVWELGPDGSYDALYYYRSLGAFDWLKNVTVAEEYNRKITRREQEAVRKAEQERLRAAGIDWKTPAPTGGQRP